MKLECLVIIIWLAVNAALIALRRDLSLSNHLIATTSMTTIIVAAILFKP